MWATCASGGAVPWKRQTTMGVSQISHSAIQQISSSQNQGVSFRARQRSQSVARVNCGLDGGVTLTALPYLILRAPAPRSEERRVAREPSPRRARSGDTD